MTTSTETLNRLINEKSPYLLQHAHNPVDWWPWCDEAFSKAKTEDKPVFVSIGYSTCHWCHVMAHESFEDGEVAEILNRGFVCIKVDREERADVDAFLMRACQLMTGSGGWPLSAFLSPDGKPFYAGTYFPKRGTRGQIGFVELLETIGRLWREDRAQLTEATERLLNAAREQQHVRSGQMRPELIERCRLELGQGFDPTWGGFGRAPKFPTPHVLMFLLRHGALTGDEQSIEMALSTLGRMALGGIQDQIGGGFCRYSTDRYFLAPHFEKMLYDNALLALCYVEAFQQSGDARWSRVAERTLDYAIRELRGGHGGFFAAQDADSQGEEGAYYLFNRDEVLRELGPDDGARVCETLDITSQGNFEGLNIPNRLHRGTDLPESLRPLLDRLYEYRRGRMTLRTDDKVLTSWNALMIAALAAASHALGRRDYLDIALKARGFIESHLRDAEGGLMVRWRDGEAAVRGQLDDYAFLCWADTMLYDATLNSAHMQSALALLDQLMERFLDAPGQGCFLSDGHGLAVRPKESFDNALPSGNSVLGVALARLYHYTDDERIERMLDDQLRYLAGAAEAAPSGHAFALVAALMTQYPTSEIVCASTDDAHIEAFQRHLGARFLPNTIAFLNDPRKDAPLPEWVRACAPIGGRTTYYLCKDHACALPVHDLAELPL